MTTIAPTTFADPTKPRRRRRWGLRILVGLVLLILTIVVLTQLLLWSDYPRRIAESQVERILNVRTSIKSVSIGWLGHTRIEGVVLTLPMEKEPFLTVDRIDAEHASLPLIAFQQNLSELRIAGVRATARQEESGRWNLEQLIPPPSTKPADATNSPPRNPLALVPSLQARDIRATLIRKDGQRLELPVFEADLAKPDPLVAKLNARAGDVVSIEGQLGQSATLPQSLRAKLTRVPSDVAAFFGVSAPPLTADVKWEGRLTGSGVAGSFELVDVQSEGTRATGRVDIEAGEGGRIDARPTSLAVTAAKGAVDANLTSGQLVFDRTLSLEAIGGTLNGGRVGINGTFDPATFVGDVTAQWEQVTRDTIATTGSARLRSARLLNGNIHIVADARGGGRVPAGEAVGAIFVDGEVDPAGTVRAALKLEPFTWTPADGSAAITTPALEGQASLIGDDARLDAHAVRDSRAKVLAAYAGGHLKTMDWWATLDGAELRLPELEAKGVKGPIDFSVAAYGTHTRYRLTNAYVKIEKGTAWAEGTGDLAPPLPLQMNVWAWYDKPVTEDEAAQLNALRVQSNVNGTLEPRALNVQLDVSGSELVFAQRRIGDVALQLAGTVSEDEASVESQELEALGGHWSVRGYWSKEEQWPPTVLVRFRDLPAANLGELVNREDLQGKIDTGTATLRIGSSRLDRIEMTASARGSALSAGPFKAESLELAATLKDGQFDVRPTLREQGGTIAAQIRGDVMMRTNTVAAVTLEDWPAPYVMSTAAGAESFRPRASGKLNAEASLKTGQISGDVNLNGTVERGDSKLADFRVEGALRDKLITVSNFHLDTLDGTLAATAKVDLNNYHATVVNAEFDRLTPARLAWSNPIFGEVQGRLNGTFAVRPSVAPRPMGPLEIELNARPEGVSLRGVRVGDVNMLAYAELKSPEQFRLVTERAVINIAGGRIEPFARLSNEPGRGLAQLVTANFSGIDLGELSRAADKDGKEIVGKIGGRVQVYGQTTNLNALTADATVEITESDLANFGPISALYNALAVGTAGNQPIGTGTVVARVGGGVLTLEDATYFNRGVYANAFGSVSNIADMPDSTVDQVIVVGSLQPLRAVKLPFFGDVNDTLAALQTSLTAIEVTGTVKEPKMQQVSIGALGETFQKVLLGKTRNQD